MRIPQDLSDVNQEWIHASLQHKRPFPDTELKSFSIEIIGEGIGFMGEVVKLTLEYASTSEFQNSTHSTILKLPTQTANRNIGEMLGVYEREVRFYNELQHQIDVRTPRFFVAVMDKGANPEIALRVLKFVNRLPTKIVWWLFLLGKRLPSKTRNYALLLEDLSNLRPGNQVAGCNLQDARTALRGMARLHAQYWDDTSLTDIAWIIPLELGAKAGHAVFLDCLPRYIEANKENLTPRHYELLEWLKANAIELYRLYSGLPATLLHGDFRLDNIFFDDENNEIVLCDWQTLMNGPAGIDLAYFLSASLDKNSTETGVTELLTFYSNELDDHGIKIDRETLEWSYQAGMLIILHKVIPAEYQDILELKGDRGHQLAITWIERILQKLETLELQEVLRSKT